MMAVIIPGLLISILGIFYVSRQRNARQLSLREKYETFLARILEETEKQIDSAVKKVFVEISDAQTNAAVNNPDALQRLLKNILLQNPVVKYPFLINARGTYIFPFSKKTGLLSRPGETFYHRYKKGTGKDSDSYHLYKQAENLEFKARRFFQAIKFYLNSLEKTGEKKIKSHIYHAIARCYYKLNKFPQAANYLEDIIRESPGSLEEDKRFYFTVLHLAARAYKQMNLQDEAVDLYLRLYDEILQYEYELPGAKESFAFFKNEALDYLNHHIRKSSRESERFKRARALVGFDQLSELDIDLQWKYFDMDTLEMRAGIKKGGEDAFTFDKIREFYLPTDRKTLFYKKVKEAKLWAGAGGTAALQGQPGMDIVHTKISSDDPGTRELFFGFMISLDFVRTQVLPAAVKKYLEGEPLTVVIEDKNKTIHPVKLFKLKHLPFKTFFTTRALSLFAHRQDHIETLVEREMWINYGLILVIISLLIVSTWFFYKYITRETALVRMKSDFVDSASHTLKTPLTRIRMMAEKMELGWIKDEQKKKEYFQVILSETDRMAEMINNMLDFSKVEAGRKHYEMKQGSITEHVQAVVDSLSTQVKNPGFQLQVELQNDIPPLNFDPEALKLILVNLVQNALKYSKDEKYIAIKLYKEEHHAVIKVEDRGMGIPEKEREKIFDKFYRIPDENVKAAEGSGLGLFLVRHAVKAHKGHIKVNSNPGKGSTFNIYLPFKESPQNTQKTRKK
jgi:signal transduction histidine kinase/tetratricopeptide (TPR) repeat protein